MDESGFHVAQVNIALPREPLESPLLAEFVDNLEPVNALADSSPGFVWRLQTEDGDATSIRAFGDDSLLINMSVWESVEALWSFVYDGRHLAVMRRRREWFDRIEMHMCLWWVPVGHLPGLEEAEDRLGHLQAHGPSSRAFTFKRRFGQPSAPRELPARGAELAGCPAD
jgi:hypothetical protein